jgi:hypothetical protein
MADEPLWVRRREDDGMDARVAVDPVHDRLCWSGDIDAEHGVRPPSTRTIRTAPR